jgi:cyanate permease
MVGVIPVIIGPLMAGIIFDKTDSYDLAFVITIVIFVSGAVFMALASRPEPPPQERVGT